MIKADRSGCRKCVHFDKSFDAGVSHGACLVNIDLCRSKPEGTYDLRGSACPCFQKGDRVSYLCRQEKERRVEQENFY